MEIVSYHKYLRMKPSMLKSLAKKTVGLSPQNAIERLEMVSVKGARFLAAAIKSSLSNATKNRKLDSALLKIKSIEILKGPFFKRWQPVSRGIAHQIQKRTSHIRVKLEEIKKEKSIDSKPVPKVHPEETRIKAKDQTKQKENYGT